ncbi:hypothetical protein VTK73DRAFT_3037 [Phialemonium thermophilum]|uniref:Uncharacterized protein n=1 Tax=Phialemonium thermophilum TaxID=223376 RepID=A0ABR3X1Z9_9PEZI
MAATFEQIIRFGTDAVGLERFFRLIQALLQVVVSFKLPFDAVIGLLNFSWSQHERPATDRFIVRRVLTELHSRVNLGRRFFRVFRFLESFNAAYKLWNRQTTVSSSTSSPGTLETYLRILSHSFNGMYLILETMLLPDALGIDGLRLWTARWSIAGGQELGAWLNVEAMRFWFFALLCGALAGGLRLLDLWAFIAVPENGEGYSALDDSGLDLSGKVKENDVGHEAADLRRKQEEERRRKEQREKSRVRRTTQFRAVARRLVADVLDLSVPGSAVGYVKADAGTVGLAMVVTTILTGLDAWERCGREVEAAST